MKKYLNELDFQSFCAIWDKSDYMKNRSLDYLSDDAYYSIDDVLHDAPKGTRYEIQGHGYGYSYVSFHCDYSDVLRYVEKLNLDYCLFDDENKANIEKFSRYIDALERYWYENANIKSKDLEFLEKSVDHLQSVFENVLADFLASFYDFDDDYAKENAFECDWFSDCYVDENGDVFVERDDLKIA